MLNGKTLQVVQNSLVIMPEVEREWRCKISKDITLSRFSLNSSKLSQLKEFMLT